mmetsp:Transcript_29774/g.61482  ORF Transcript_29774/g.61482 Transcript_29774/m.61482 type:complete len:257 (+) Transcript_29774:139-909(+)
MGRTQLFGRMRLVPFHRILRILMRQRILVHFGGSGAFLTVLPVVPGLIIIQHLLMNLMTGGAHGHLRYGPGDLVLAGVSAVRPILTGRPFIFSQAAAATREIPKGPGKWTPDHGQTPQSWKNYHNDHGETEPCGGFIEKRRRVAGALLVEALDGMGYCRLCCWIKDEPFPAPEGFIRIHGALTTVDVANIVAVGIGLTPNILRALLLALLLSVNGAKVAFHIDVHCSFAIAIKGIQWLSNGVTNALALNAAGSVCG